MRKCSEASEENYPIIWYEPNLHEALQKDLTENKALYFFSEFQEAAEFSQSLEISFLLIVPEDFDEQHLTSLKKDIYGIRRLADFEEETILQELAISELLKAYVFYTDEDFESEVFVGEEWTRLDVTEAARGFREELIFWERKRRGLEDADAVFERAEESQEFDVLESLCDIWGFGEEEESFWGSRRFYMRSLKGIIHKRKQEKKKLVYYVSIGECCLMLREYERALEYYTKAFDIVEQIYGEGHPNTASLYEGLARIYSRMEDYGKAIGCVMRLIEIRESFDGEMHSGTASLYEKLGSIYNCMKEYEKTIECYLKAIEIKKALGRDLTRLYENLDQSYKDLVKVFSNQREYEKAIELSLKFIEVRKSLYGETHTKVGDAYNDLGVIYSLSGRYEKTIEFYLKAVEILKSDCDRFDFRLFSLYSEIARTCKFLKDSSKALEYLMKGLKQEKCNYREFSWWEADQYVDVAKEMIELGDYRNAVKCLSRALAIEKLLLLEDLGNRDIISRIRDVNQRLNQCEQVIERSVRIYETDFCG